MAQCPPLKDAPDYMYLTDEVNKYFIIKPLYMRL